MAFKRSTSTAAIPSDPVQLYRKLAETNDGPDSLWFHQGTVLLDWHKNHAAIGNQRNQNLLNAPARGLSDPSLALSLAPRHIRRRGALPTVRVRYLDHRGTGGAEPGGEAGSCHARPNEAAIADVNRTSDRWSAARALPTLAAIPHEPT